MTVDPHRTVDHEVSCLGPSIAARLTGLLAERVGAGPQSVLTDGRTPAEWGLDSIDYVVLLAVVQQEFGTELLLAEAPPPTLAALIAHLAGQRCACPRRDATS